MCKECEEKKSEKNQTISEKNQAISEKKLLEMSSSNQVKLSLALLCVGIAYLLLIDVVF